MEDLQKINRSDQDNTSDDRAEKMEKVYSHNDATVKLEKLMDMKKEIIQNINDIEYAINLFNNLYKLSFQDADKEDQSKHIMYRVLVGTNISEREQDLKFIFDDRDKEILEIFNRCKEIFSGRAKQEDKKAEIKKYVDTLLKRKGLLPMIH